MSAEMKWRIRALKSSLNKMNKALDHLDNTLTQIEDWIFGRKNCER